MASRATCNLFVRIASFDNCGCRRHLHARGVVQHDCALFLILEYTGSEFLLGMLFTVRMAGFAILQPFIGLLADRYNRKMLMVVSNLLQAGFALCFLLVNDS